MLQRQLELGGSRRWLAVSVPPEPFAQLPKELLQALPGGQTCELRNSRYMIENVVAKNLSYARGQAGIVI